MAPWLKRLADVRAGEGRWVLGAFLAQLGMVAGHTTLETARDALFLSRLPASRLAVVYAGVALGTLLLSAANARIVERLGQRNAFFLTLVAGSFGTALFHLQPLTEPVLFALYGWSALVGALLAMQFWMFAGQVFTVTQGKRLFGLIASGGTIGAVTGGAVSAALLPFAPTQSLLLVSAGLFMATALVFTVIPVGGAERTLSSLGTARTAKTTTSILGMFRSTPYLSKVTVFTVSGTGAVLLVDYLFKTTAAAHVPRDELGVFLARTYATLSAFGLAFQLLLTGRIMRRLGVVPALLILPLCVAMGTSAMVALGGSVVIALLTKGADGGLRYSLHRVASELLWSPLSGELRIRAKALIDTVLGKVTQAAVAGVLLVLVPLGLHSSRVIAAMAFGLTAIWVASIGVLRGAYLDLFRKALARGEVELGPGELDRSSIEAVLEALSAEDTDRVIHAMELLTERNHARLIPGIILYHDKEEVLVRALDLAATPDRHDWQRLAVRLLDHSAEAVRIAAILALSRAGEYEAVQKARGDASPVVRAHALLLGAPDEAAEGAARELLEAEGRPSEAVRRALLDAVRERPHPRWTDLVMELARDADAETAEHAAKAMAQIADPRFVPWLISRLTTRAGRSTVRTALVHQGEPALDALAKAVLDPATPPRLRLHLPRTISRFGSQRAADLLADMLRIEPRGAVRYKALRGLGRLSADTAVKVDAAPVERLVRTNLVEALRLVALEAAISTQPPTTTLELIVAILGDKRRQALERVFRLLHIVHRHEDVESVSHALSSGDARQRANALEFLEQLTAVAARHRRSIPLEAATLNEIRELLRILAEDHSDAERAARGARFMDQPPRSAEDALAVLEADTGPALAQLASLHRRELEEPRAEGRVSSASLKSTPPPAAPSAKGTVEEPPPPVAPVRQRAKRDLEHELFLRQMSFGRLVGPAAARLTHNATEIDFEPGQTIYAFGAPVTHMFLVARGDVELRSESEPAQRMAAPSAIGIVDGMGARVHQRTAVALTPIQALALPIQDWLRAIEDDFELAQASVVGVAEDLAGIVSKLTPDGGFSPRDDVSARGAGLHLAERIALLLEVPGFAGATVEALARIAAGAEEIEVTSGAVLHDRGDASSEVLVVADGIVQLTNEVHVVDGRVGPGQVVGGTASLGVRTHPFAASVVERTTVLSIRREDLADVMEDHVDLFRSVMLGMNGERRRALALRSERRADASVQGT